MQVFDPDRKRSKKYIKARNERADSVVTNTLIDYRSYQLTKKERQHYFLFYGSLLGVCGYLFYKSLVVAVFFSLFSIFGLSFYKKDLADRRKETLRIELRDMLYSISATLSAGNSMKTALLDAEKAVSLIYGKDSILAQELIYMSKMIRQARSSEELLLRDFATRCGVEEVVNFVDVYSTCRRTGGDLNQVIIRASQMIVDKISITKEINTLTSHKKVEIRMLAVIPAGVLMLMQLASPDYLSIMYTSILGRLIMSGSLVCIVVSLAWSTKLTRIKV